MFQSRFFITACCYNNRIGLFLDTDIFIYWLYTSPIYVFYDTYLDYPSTSSRLIEIWKIGSIQSESVTRTYLNYVSTF